MENRGGSYILPFFWLHGEPHDVLREEIDRIEACGIQEFCVESRPHPDFAGEGWWRDLDMIMAEARKRGMRVWVLDDDRFPTGHAAGGYELQPEKAKLYLAERHMDICGPVESGAVLIENFLGADGSLLRVFACKRMDMNTSAVSLEDAVDLTEQVHEGIVYFDLPEGYYRLFVLYTTQTGGGRKDYMNLIDSDSVKVLLDQVYEKHYEHFKADFGKTFAGFFSDEPELGNVPGYGFDERLGQKNVRLPWSRELAQLLNKRWQRDFFKNMIALWYKSGTKTKAIRQDYMDSVSLLVASCFSGQIGAWCHAHGVEYIGHVIEDDNAHARLGCSIAHFFRAETGMDMAGIDLVHLQLIPGFKECDHQWIASDRDGEFFHFGLAKLGSSLAHLDKRKKGRALCEIFGSFGWAEGTWLMKWLTDHMLVRGINTFVPHAFSPCFPDRDCPPHFYARGNNPQYPYFIHLMKYMNRMCHLLSGGKQIVQAAVLYHAEAEWSDKTEYFQKPVRKLMEHQMDCDIVWNDLLDSEAAGFDGPKLVMNGQSYYCLILPKCRCLPASTARFICRAALNHFPVLFMDGLPEQCLERGFCPKQLENMAEVVPGHALARRVREICGQPEIQLAENETCCPDLRASAYIHKDGIVYMFFNEHPSKALSADVLLKSAGNGRMFKYDAVANRVYKAPLTEQRLHLSLSPGQSAVYIYSELYSNEEVLQWQADCCEYTALPESCLAEDMTGRELFDETIPIGGPWDIFLKEAGIDETFHLARTGVESKALTSINAPEAFPGFSGTILYRAEFELMKNNDNDHWVMEFPGLHDAATIRMNGHTAGVLLGSPYKVDVTPFLNDGTNTIEVESVNTLTWRVHDGQSTHMHLYPTGMVKAPLLLRCGTPGGTNQR